MTIDTVNQMPRDEFTRKFGPIFEHSPWIAQATVGPFEDVNDLFIRLCETVSASNDDQKLALIRAHLDLVGKLASQGKLTKESTAEQKAAGLMSLSEDEKIQFETFNAAYKKKFGFPFVICARENKKSAILVAFPERMNNAPPQELNAALSEIYKIARLRLIDLFKG